MGGLKTAGVRLVAENEAAFIRAINNARTGELRLTEQTRQMVPAMAGTGSASDVMRGKMDALTVRIDFQKRQLEILRAQLAATVQKYGEGSIQAERQRLAIDRLTQSLKQGETQQQQYKAALASGSQGATALTGVISGLTTAMGYLGIAVSGAMIIGKLFEIIKTGIAEAAEEEVIIVRLSSAIKSMGRESEYTTAGLTEMSLTMMRQNAVSHESIMDLEGMFITYRNISSDVMPKAIQASLDLSAAWGIDLHTAGMRIGKMLEYPTRNLNTLARVGVQFTEQQKEEIKTLEESGNLLGAQSIILQALADKFGGQATAKAKTFTGQLALLNAELKELMEFGGGIILPGLTSATGSMARSIGFVNEALATYQGRVMTLPGLIQQAQHYAQLYIDTTNASADASVRDAAAVIRAQDYGRSGIALTEQQITLAREYEQALLDQNVASVQLANAQQAYAAGQTAWMQVGTDAAQGLDKYMREGSDKWRAAQTALDMQMGTSIVAQYDYNKALDDAAKKYAQGKLSVDEYTDAVVAAGEKKGLTPMEQLKADALEATQNLEDAKSKLMSFPAHTDKYMTIWVSYRRGKSQAASTTGGAQEGGDFEFQEGGQFQVGGTGGPDSKLIRLALTPGEVVTVTPPNEPTPYGGPATAVTIGQIVEQGPLDTQILLAALQRIGGQ